MSPASRICAWCESVRDVGDADAPATHGICPDCMVDTGLFEVESLAEAPPDVLDGLPFGVVRVDREGTVVGYNRREEEIAGTQRENVMGRNFFTDIAPCTAVGAFQGRVTDLFDAGDGGRDSLSFVFRFPGRSLYVKVAAVHDRESDTVTLLVRAAD